MSFSTLPRNSDPFANLSLSLSQMKSSYDGVPGDARYKSHDPFDPFTLWDDSKRSYRRPSQAEQETLYVKLLESFQNLSSLSVVFPWCILEFNEALPPYNDRPFLVAGLVAVYLLTGEEYPLGTTYMGSPGRGFDSIDPDDITQDLTPYHVPSFSTFEYLHNAVELAQHFSSYPKQLLFELSELSDAEFENILSTLPRKFGSMLAYYVNGEFVDQLSSCPVKIPNHEVGASDIRLLQPVVPLSNQFSSVDCSARPLVKTSDIADDDIVSVDSCFTGPQRMLFVGTRTAKRKRRTAGPTHPNYYVTLEQDIYTSSDPIIPKPPVGRMGMFIYISR